MRKIIIYYFTIITIVSCNKTKITNISVKELNNDEINNSYLTGVKIKKNLDKLILMAYESENLKYQS